MPNGWQRGLGVQFLVAIHEAVAVTWAQALCLLQSQDSVSLRCACIGFPMGVSRSLPGTASCWGQLPGALSETLLAAAPSKGTSFPGRVPAESLAGEPVPLRSTNACKGHQWSIAASRNISHRQRCHTSAGAPALAGAAGSVRDIIPTSAISPCVSSLSVPGVSVPGVSVWLRTFARDPCKSQPECNQ